MKTKNKVIASLEIAIVLCSLFFVALPAIAAEQNQEMQKASANTITTSSEDDFVLGVYGNANEDDTIDMRDLTYVKLIFFGKKPDTELADAKYDGKINPLDFIQIKLIIVGKDKELTIVDEIGRIVTVNKPIKKIITASATAAESLRILKALDRVVGVTTYIVTKSKYKIYFPELRELPGIGGHYDIDYEKVYDLDPDVFITYGLDQTDEKYQKIIKMLEPRTKVLALGRSLSLREDLPKLGYLLDKEEEAAEFIDWHDRVMNTIKERVGEISEEDKPRVYHEYSRDYKTCTKDAITRHANIVNAGGINIAADLPGRHIEIDPEWLMVQNPDVIVRTVSSRICSYDKDDPTAMKEIYENIMDRPELANTPAVKNKRVFVISTNLFESARNFVAIAYSVKWYHPELFEDLDPKAIHQEWLTEFQGLDYDLDEHGVFVYHPEEHPDGK